MKNNLSIALLLLALSNVIAQEIPTISQDWASIDQSINIQTDTIQKFKLRASVKVDSKDENAYAALWAVVETDNDEMGFVDNMSDRKITTNEWQVYEIIGEVNENSKSIGFGGYAVNNGKFYFDDFELLLQDVNGEFVKTNFSNASFDKPLKDNLDSNWEWGLIKNDKQYKIKEFNYSIVEENTKDVHGLLIEGKGIKYVPYGIIGKEDGDNPLIDSMISMLDDLKSRVVYTTQTLSDYEVDHLHDEEANRIGALIMHLAAAEVFYQIFTFEGRSEFNAEEKEKWEAALDLGSEAREKFKGKSISYYLDIYDEVRAKTIAELEKRDDDWFKEIQPAYNWANQYCWFHVMEHQSSHLGQILFLKKRIPPEGEITLSDKIKD